jgi:hypothetical protein
VNQDKTFSHPASWLRSEFAGIIKLQRPHFHLQNAGEHISLPTSEHPVWETIES